MAPLPRSPPGSVPSVGPRAAVAVVTVVVSAGHVGARQGREPSTGGAWSPASSVRLPVRRVPLLPVVFGSVGGADGPRHRPSDAARLPSLAWMAVAVAIAAGPSVGVDHRVERVPDPVAGRRSRSLSARVIGRRDRRRARGAVAAPAPSPDMVGIDEPLSRADAMDAGRALGFDEDEFEALVAAPPPRPARARSPRRGRDHERARPSTS